MSDAAQGSGEKTFCPGCGEDVNTYSVERDGMSENRCNFCGLTLISEFKEERMKEVDCIMISEDNELIREMLHDSLVANKVAKKVIPSENGFDFISKLIGRFGQRQPIDLIILDIQMPIMSGINAAVALRAIETGLKRENRRVPILFFSVKKCDETLRKVLTFCEPAQYVNKGTSDTKEQMFERVKQVIAHLLR
jgi:CheY-like chemotaxis protein